jgi:hypothetical protein
MKERQRRLGWHGGRLFVDRVEIDGKDLLRLESCI